MLDADQKLKKQGNYGGNFQTYSLVSSWYAVISLKLNSVHVTVNLSNADILIEISLVVTPLRSFNVIIIEIVGYT